MDSFGKIIGILISVLMLFIVPLMYLAQKQDVISQSFVSNETSKFIDSIKNTGHLSYEMYLSYVRKIDATNNVYDIDLVHSHKVVEPIYDETTENYLQEVNIYYYNTYKKDIISEIDRTGDYYFNQGDYISVKVVNKNKTYAARLQELIFSTDIPKEQIFVTYGGMIRSETN